MRVSVWKSGFCNCTMSKPAPIAKEFLRIVEVHRRGMETDWYNLIREPVYAPRAHTPHRSWCSCEDKQSSFCWKFSLCAAQHRSKKQIHSHRRNTWTAYSMYNYVACELNMQYVVENIYFDCAHNIRIPKSMWVNVSFVRDEWRRMQSLDMSSADESVNPENWKKRNNKHTFEYNPELCASNASKN